MEIQQPESQCLMCGHRARMHSLTTIYGVYYRCSNCGSENRSSESVSENTFERNQKEFYSERPTERAPLSIEIALRSGRNRLELLKRYLKCGSIIEVGPGGGEFLTLANRNGFDTTAVEHSKVFSQMLRSKNIGKVVNNAVEQISGMDNSHQAACSFHVIEHVVSPEQHILAMKKLLKRDGYLLIATPSAKSFSHRRFKGHSPVYSSAHLRVISPQGLSLMLNRLGFDVLEVKTRQPEFQLFSSISGVLRLLSSHRSKATVQTVKTPDTSARRGKLVANTPLPLGVLLLSVNRYLLWPINKFIEKFGGGSELICVAVMRTEDGV